jgi:hypothetical protein
MVINLPINPILGNPMKKQWYLLELANKPTQTVFISNSAKSVFKAMIEIESGSKIISFRKIGLKTTPTEYLDCVAKIHINKKKERNRISGQKDGIQKFIDRFRNTKHIQVRFSLFTYQTHVLKMQGSGTLIATNNYPIS